MPPKKAAQAKTQAVIKKAVASGAITRRAVGVIKKQSREINAGAKGGSTTRFTRSAVRDVAGKKGKGYTPAIVKSARKNTTKAEAKGVRKVLKRQGPKPTSSRETAARRRRAL